MRSHSPTNSVHNSLEQTSRLSANHHPLRIMLHRFEAETPAHFDAMFKTASDAASQLGAPLFVHVTSSWCPDCIRADPAIHAAFETRTEPAVVLTARVPDRSAYRSPSFPYRSNPTLQLTAIPTVIRFADAGTSRLVEYDCYDQSKLTSLIHH